MVTTSCDFTVIFGDLMVIYVDGLGFYGYLMGLYCNDVFTVEFHGIYRNRQIIKSNPKAMSSYCSIKKYPIKKKVGLNPRFLYTIQKSLKLRCSNPHEGVILHHFCWLSRKNPHLLGGWPARLKNMTSSVGMTFPNWMESHKTPWFQSPPTSHFSSRAQGLQE